MVHLFTVDRGTIRASAPGSLKVRNRFGSLFELFTEGEFQYYWQENRDMITISKGEIIQSYFQTVSDPGRIFYFYLISDIFRQFIPFNEKDDRLYRLLHSILTHSQEGISMNLLLLYFLIWALRIEGLMFNPRMCSNCGRPDLSRAWIRLDFRGILCETCRSTENTILTQEDLEFLKWTERHSPKELEVWTALDVSRLIRIFTKKIEYHGECTLKSTQYLPEFG